MQTEILDYRYVTAWELDKLLSDPTFNENLDTHWPLVTTTFSGLVTKADETVWRDFIAGKRRGKPTELRNSQVHSTLSYAGDRLGASRQVLNVHAACASSLYALYTASLMSQDLNCPVVVFCADNLKTDYHLWHFKSFGALDQETGRPFDSTSKGFKMGIGAAVYLIKHPSVKHTMPAKAFVQNYSFYTNPALVANPGSAQDIVNNITGINYKAIDFWNAHATGTPVGDAVEHDYFAKTITQDIPIVSYKGYIGHCMSAAGAIEIAMALDGKRDNLLLANKLEGNVIVNDSRIITQSTSFAYKKMLKTSLGFGGKTAVAEIDLY
jgi:3-oxoacyl-(acyl-carrier-protein) synthase